MFVEAQYLIWAAVVINKEEIVYIYMDMDMDIYGYLVQLKTHWSFSSLANPYKCISMTSLVSGHTNHKWLSKCPTRKLK